MTAAATWVVLGGTSLAREGAALAGELDRGDLAAARARLPGLCGRDPSTLDAGGLARAGTESMAENTSDAVVAPLLWGAVAGVPGLLGYRAVNTLDAMVGHRSPRYARFGWAAARLDDVGEPAAGAGVRAADGGRRAAGRRFAAGGAAGVAARRGGAPEPERRPGGGGGGRGARASPSAAAPCTRTAVEERPRLGDGPPPGPADLRRAVRLCRLVSAASTAVAVALAAGAGRRSRRRSDGRRRRPARAARPPGATGGLPAGAAASRGG